MLSLIVFILNIVLILASWNYTAYRVPVYTALACLDFFYYLFTMIKFMVSMKKNPERKGLTLLFVVNQFFLLITLCLFKLTDLFFLNGCR